jgi:hypothetical protein
VEDKHLLGSGRYHRSASHFLWLSTFNESMPLKSPSGPALIHSRQGRRHSHAHPHRGLGEASSLLIEHDGLIHFHERPLDHRLRQSVSLQYLIIAMGHYIEYG